MTNAQKVIRRHERAAKRTQKQTWDDVRKLLKIVVEGGYARQNTADLSEKREYYLQAMQTITRLKGLRKKTRENATQWTELAATIQRLLQMSKSHG